MASSAGPQRPAKSAKKKEKGTGKGEGRRKHTPRGPIHAGVDWSTAYSRFYIEMVKICIDRPTGEVLNPEAAYAKTKKIIEDDLHLSVSNFFYCGRNHRLINLFVSRWPLVAKQFGERPHQDMAEQYLTAFLDYLRPRKSGQQRGLLYTLEQGRWIACLRIR